MSPEFVILTYKNYTIRNKEMYLTFDISLIDNSIEKKDLEKILKQKIPYLDRDYIKLDSFTKKQVVYKFDEKKWFKDSNLDRIVDTQDRFEKRIKLQKLPNIISSSLNALDSIKFVEESFRNYVEANNKIKKNISTCIKPAIRPFPMSYFKLTYDSYFNTINISLKPEFRIQPMLFISMLKSGRPIRKVDFDASVYTILKTKR